MSSSSKGDVKISNRKWNWVTVATLMVSSLFVSALPATPVHAAGNGYYDVATAMGASLQLSCGVFDGFAKCWGKGPMGTGLAADQSNVPIMVKNSTAGNGNFVNDGHVTQISVGQYGGCLVTNDTKLFCWGSYILGSGTAATTASTTPKVVSSTNGFVNDGTTTITKINVTYKQACAIQSGKVWCWGTGYTGGSTATSATDTTTPLLVPADVTSGFANNGGVKDVDIAGSVTCIVEDNLSGIDTVYCFGSNPFGQVGAAANPTKVPQIIPDATDASFDNRSAKRISRVSVGGTHVCAIQDGIVFCWGGNSGGVVGQSGGYNATPKQVPDNANFVNSNISDISSNGQHTCALKAGIAYCWGSATDARLGIDGTATGAPAPVSHNTVTSVTNSGMLSLGESSDGSSYYPGTTQTCGATATTIKCWGLNDYGQIGSDFAATTGSTSLISIPIDATPRISLSSTFLEPKKGLGFPGSFSYSVTDNRYIELNSPSVGYPAVTYVVSPTLPTGLSLNQYTGLVSGVPSGTSARTTYTLTATNAAGSSTATFDIEVTLPPAPSISLDSTILYAVTNQSLTSPYAIANAGGPVDSSGYSISPSLPTGLSMSTSTGLISGTATATSARATYTITATGPGGTSTATFSLAVTGVNPVITLSASTASVPMGSPVSNLYSITNTGAQITSYAITPTLTTGLSFDTTTGLISGTPPAPVASRTYTITATSAGGSHTRTFSLTVNNIAPAIALSSSSATISVGANASNLYTLSSSGGVIASFSISPSAPSGMSFDTTTGLLTGTPSSAQGATTFTITATNSVSTSQATFTLTVSSLPTTTAPALSITQSPSTIAPSSQTGTPATAATAAAPKLVTSGNQAQLEAKPGTANAIINGKEVAVEIVKAPVEATTEQLKRTADSIVADIADLLPAGVTNPVSARTTPSGVVINGIMVNPDDPKEKLGVPVESVQLVKAGDTAVLLAALNQTNLPAEKGSGGALEVTRGGLVSATAYGLPGNETGEIVLMSTPRLLQTFTVDKNGGFKGQVPLPKDIAFGSHTVVMATKNAKVSLGIKLVRTKMQFRIKRRISSSLFLNRAGVVKVGGGKITVRGAGRCRASAKRVVMAAKPGGCYITVRQAAKGANKAIYYRFTVSVVKKLPKKVATKKK